MKTIKKLFSSGLSATRARLGLTQTQMAEHLEISTSLVKLVETKRRTLTSEKLVKLAALEIELSELNREQPENLPAAIQQIHKSCNSNYEVETAYQQSRCRHQAKQLEKRLQRMQVEYGQVNASLKTIEALSRVSNNHSDAISLAVLYSRPKLLKKLNRCSLPAQSTLKNKIALLYAEAALNQSIHPRYVHTIEKPTINSQLKQKQMEYTVSMISTRTDCQAMIDMANDDKDALVYRKTGLLRQKQAASSTTVGIDADLSSAIAEIAALQSVIGNLPDGPVKDDTTVKLTKAQYKKFLLEQRKANYGSIALVEKEYNIACAEQSIAETDAFILALTNRMNELPAV